MRLFATRYRLWLSAAIVVTGLYAAQGEVEVHVTGRGDSELSARSDAIRLALQQTMSQLVIADRVVQGDRLLRDTVLSTMNGFVNRFEPIRTYREGQEIVTEANVSVSSARIENFLSAVTGTSASVRGSDLSAGVQAQLLAVQARAEILWRLFAGYPGKAISVKIEKVGVSETDPNLIAVDYSLTTDPNFVASLKQGLRALARQPTPSASLSKKESLGSKIKRWDQSLERMANSQNVAVDTSRVCFGNNLEEVDYSQTLPWECYPIPPAEYRAYYMKHYASGRNALFGVVERMVLLVDFVDQGGVSVLRGGPLKIDAREIAFSSTRDYHDPRTPEAGEWPLMIRINAFKARKGRFVVPVSQIGDLHRMSKITVVPTATGGICGTQSAMFDMPGCKSWDELAQEVRFASELNSSSTVGGHVKADPPTPPVKLPAGVYTNKYSPPHDVTQGLTPQEAIREAVASEFDCTALGLVVQTKRTDTPVPNSMEIVLYADPRRIGFERKGDRMTGKIEVFSVQQNDRGNQFNGRNDTIDLSLTEEKYRQAMTAGLSYHTSIPLVPGATQIRLVVHDSGSGRIGSLTVPQLQATAQNSPGQ
jgi:hypothetical protein